MLLIFQRLLLAVFAVGMLTGAMGLANAETSGLALGAWGAVQATCGGLAVAFSGVIRDAISTFAIHGTFGRTLQTTATGYASVYAFEVVLLFVTLIALGPLVRVQGRSTTILPNTKFGLVQYPG